ncbi:MAG: ATP/GTP-binding protein [Streptosporangiales bacterium]|nr:ATP/GTP-binding protein [Streptosporangiales bacterium]
MGRRKRKDERDIPETEPTGEGLAVQETTKLTRKGLNGRGGGKMSYLDLPQEYRATTRQVCGLWPFIAGAGTPMIGVPLGRDLITGSTLCMDPIAWFERASLIANPSMFTLALPGLGKSTVQRRLLVGLNFRGTVGIVPGDTKGEYSDIIEALGGSVVRLGRGQGTLNPLDLGEMGTVSQSLTGRAREELSANARGRRSNMVAALIAIARRGSVSGDEENFIDAAVQLLEHKHSDGDAPILEDLGRLIQEGPEELRLMTLSTEDDAKYAHSVEPLMRSLLSLVHGPLGKTFNAQTSNRFPLDRPASVDLSSIPASDQLLEGSVLLACWAEAFATVEAADALAVSKGERPRHFYLVLDELWRILRAGVGLVDRIDELTRLNRTYGVGQSMTTHTMSDLESLRDQEDVAKAKGFVERAGLIICGGLPRREMQLLNQIVPMTRREQQLIVSWSTPPSLDQETGRETAPPGRGKFLVKVGGQAGMPFEMVLTPAELSLNDTNRKWANAIESKDQDPGADKDGVVYLPTATK